METFLAIASKRDVREYAPEPIADDARHRILDAGRLAGSSKNRQLWQFVVLGGDSRERLADLVYAPENVRDAALVVAIVGEAGAFDVGRCAQNMMLAAWEAGIASCPNGVRDAGAATELLGGEPRAVLSFGHPARARDPEGRSAEEWSGRANRKPLGELVREI